MSNQDFPFNSEAYNIIKKICFQRIHSRNYSLSAEDLIQDVRTAIYEKVPQYPQLYLIYTNEESVFWTEVSRTMASVYRQVYDEDSLLS